MLERASKRAIEVACSVLAFEFLLLRGVFHLDERGKNGDIKPVSHLVRQKFGLIESSFLHFHVGHRHEDDDFRIKTALDKLVRHKRAERLSDIRFLAEFQFVYQLLHFAVVYERRAVLHERGLLILTAIAVVALVFERNAAVKTNMPFDKRQLLDAFRAETISRVLDKFFAAYVASAIEREQSRIELAEQSLEKRLDLLHYDFSLTALCVLSFVLRIFALNFALQIFVRLRLLCLRFFFLRVVRIYDIRRFLFVFAAQFIFRLNHTRRLAILAR